MAKRAEYFREWERRNRNWRRIYRRQWARVKRGTRRPRVSP